MQDKLDYSKNEPCQTIRHLEADAGTYFYKSNLFLADNVKISHLIIKGHHLHNPIEIIEKLFNGRAKKVEFSPADKNLTVKVEGLNASFFPNKEK